MRQRHEINGIGKEIGFRSIYTIFLGGPIYRISNTRKYFRIKKVNFVILRPICLKISEDVHLTVRIVTDQVPKVNSTILQPISNTGKYFRIKNQLGHFKADMNGNFRRRSSDIKDCHPLAVRFPQPTRLCYVVFRTEEIILSTINKFRCRIPFLQAKTEKE